MKFIKQIIVVSALFILPTIVHGNTYEIKAMIETTALKYEVDPVIAKNVALCESGFNHQAKNKHSTAKGVFQFLNSSFQYYGTKLWGTTKGRSALDAEDNIELAMWVMSKRGQKDWLASKHCWSKKIA